MLVPSGLPRFSDIRSEHVAPALAQRLQEAREAVERVVACNEAPTWENLAAPLAESFDRLDQMWGAVSHLNAVVSTPELRDAYNTGLPLLTAFHSEVSQDARLFARYRALRDGALFATLPEAQQKAIDNALRDFHLGGVDLPEPQRARFKALQEEKAQLSATFDDHLLDATQDFSLLVTDEKELAGLPPDVVAEARAQAVKNGQTGWRLTLLAPCYRPVMQYAEHRPLRAALHRAYATRASELGVDPARDNAALIRRLLTLRAEQAELLGYPHYGAVSLVPKMADNVDEVLTFLGDLAKRVRPFAERDLATLRTFARETLGLDELMPWDVAFASEKLKQRDYAFSDQEVRAYFQEEKVLRGLFRVIETLFGLTVCATPKETWHSDVRHFELCDEVKAVSLQAQPLFTLSPRGRGCPEGAGEGDGQPFDPSPPAPLPQGEGGVNNDELVGRFYLDLYAREKKQGGAWMDGALPLRVIRDQIQNPIQKPVVYLTCNFPAPVDGKPATFTHDDVLTLFHEFGHGLHQLLTREPTPGVSGLEGFEWDAVELPSQLMENFCWEWEVVEAMSGHVETGAPLPRALFDKMLAARHFQAGLTLLRQIEFGLFDMRLHATQPAPNLAHNARAVLNEVRREVAVLPYADYDRFENSFGHIFAGGYAAGYYSYLWAEVLSSDAYSLFEEAGTLSAAVGRRLRDEILGRGSVRNALQSFIAFRGRPPQMDAFLRHNGII
ncbi:MAG: M3 family metallopeptidase [Proteobacteria bacterium]|nr:M3 family metallopeptidase [Pseudomonadota bacterium]